MSNTTSTSAKVTIKTTLQAIIDTCADRLTEEQMDKVKTMLEQTEKKSASRKAKTSEADLELMQIVLGQLSHEGKSVTDLRNSHDTLIPLSTPKLTALLGKLIDEGKAERYSDKRKTLFRLV